MVCHTWPGFNLDHLASLRMYASIHIMFHTHTHLRTDFTSLPVQPCQAMLRRLTLLASNQPTSALISDLASDRGRHSPALRDGKGAATHEAALGGRRLLVPQAVLRTAVQGLGRRGHDRNETERNGSSPKLLRITTLVWSQ